MVGSESNENLQITPGLVIPLGEIRFHFSRNSGPGGQNVNRRETRVELLFDLLGSPSLSDEQRQRLHQRLAGYLDGDGILHVVAGSHRKQLRNREEALQRFVQLLRRGLTKPRRRVPTAPSAPSVRRRLESKRRHSTVKQRRRSIEPEASA